MAMRCSWVRRQLIRYVEGALSREEASRVQAHLAGCAECSRELRAAKSAAGLLRATAPVAHEPGEDLWRRVAVRLPEGRPRAGRPAWSWTYAAAAVLLLVFVAFAAPMWFNQSDKQPVVKGKPAPAEKAPAVDHGQVASTPEPPEGRHDPFTTPEADRDGAFPMVTHEPSGAAGVDIPGGRAAPGHTEPPPKMAGATPGTRESVAGTAHRPPRIPFATEADRLAYGLEERPNWAPEEYDPDKAAREEASALFSY